MITLRHGSPLGKSHLLHKSIMGVEMAPMDQAMAETTEEAAWITSPKL